MPKHNHYLKNRTNNSNNNTNDNTTNSTINSITSPSDALFKTYTNRDNLFLNIIDDGGDLNEIDTFRKELNFKKRKKDRKNLQENNLDSDYDDANDQDDNDDDDEDEDDDDEEEEEGEGDEEDVDENNDSNNNNYANGIEYDENNDHSRYNLIYKNYNLNNNVNFTDETKQDNEESSCLFNKLNRKQLSNNNLCSYFNKTSYYPLASSNNDTKLQTTTNNNSHQELPTSNSLTSNSSFKSTTSSSSSSSLNSFNKKLTQSQRSAPNFATATIPAFMPQNNIHNNTSSKKTYTSCLKKSKTSTSTNLLTPTFENHIDDFNQFIDGARSFNDATTPTTAAAVSKFETTVECICNNSANDDINEGNNITNTFVSQLDESTNSDDTISPLVVTNSSNNVISTASNISSINIFNLNSLDITPLPNENETTTTVTVNNTISTNNSSELIIPIQQPQMPSLTLPQPPSQQVNTNETTITLSSTTSVNKSLSNKGLVNSFSISSSQIANGTNHFLFKDAGNSSKILDGLNKLRENRCLCDVILKVDGEEFSCHKCVLAALSNYFKAMFSGELVESKQTHVSINDIDVMTMKLIIDYAYTSKLDIHENNVQALLTAANLFDIRSIKDACCRYMEIHMDPSNCVGIHCFSDTHDCQDLKNTSFNFILTNFCKVIMHEEYLTLQKSKLIEIISDDSLNVPNEDIVFNACIRWLDFAPDTRSNEFHHVLEHIRLPLLSAYFLYDKVQSEERLKQCDESRELIQEALMYNLLKDRRNQVQNERTRSRKSFAHIEALVIVGGEDDRVVLRTVDAYFPALDRWMPLQCSPYALSKHCVVAGGENMLYMAGGEAPDSTPNETFWVYNTVLDEWKQLASLILPRAELGMAIVDGCIYAVGGITHGEKRLQSIERYDPLLNAWKNCAPMKIAISSPAVCSLNGLLYVAGGTIGPPGELVDLVQCYNPASDTWKELAPMLIPRTGCASCALNGLIYVIGGWYADDENSNRVEYYDPKVDKWFICKSMIERRHRPAVAVLNNRIYVCGGEESYNIYHDSIECYDASTDEWQIIACMNNGRSWLSCATLRLQNPLFNNEATELIEEIEEYR